VKLFSYLQVSLESLVLHKTRAILTMLGIVIGVMAVLITMGIGRGAASNITQRIQSQGTNLLTISPGATRTGGFSGGGGSARTLTMGDAEALLAPTLQPRPDLVVPEYGARAQLVYAGNNSQNQVLGTTAEYATMHNQTLADGRFMTAEEVASQRQVVVLGATLATDLFGSSEPVGQSIRVNGQPFDVVGVLKTSGGMGFDRTDTQAFIPIAVAQGRLFNAPRYRSDYTVTGITLQVANAADMDAVQRQVEQTLRLRHRLKAADANDFSIYNQASLLEMATQVSDTLALFLGAIGAVSLLVGGIGIMNIMLVSVTERTREIGLRKAVGAHDTDIMWQFLTEALTLCGLGGLLGVSLSYAIAYVLGRVPAVTFQVSIQPDTVMLAVGVSLASGLIFGLYPAYRATRLDPIEALRYE
jgi:putative ABC transport system permease protein